MTGVRRDWIAEMETLIASPAYARHSDVVADATTQANRLAALARALLDSQVVPVSCGFPDRCAVAHAIPRGCELVRSLADIPTARSLPPLPLPGVDAADAVDKFLTAMAAAGSAVYVCRRVLHPTGDCLFGGPASGGTDLCARVLVAAHQLGGPHPRL